MRRLLLDTNLLSELVRKRPSPEVVGRLRAVDPGNLYSSVICVTELRYGAARHPHGDRLWRRIVDEVLDCVEILPLGELEALRAGEILAGLAERGEPIGIEDVLIAATAVVHELTVVTRNRRHFDRVPGLRVESWWPASS